MARIIEQWVANQCDKHPDLSPEARRVLLFLGRAAKLDGWLGAFTIGGLSEATGLSRAEVNLAIEDATSAGLFHAHEPFIEFGFPGMPHFGSGDEKQFLRQLERAAARETSSGYQKAVIPTGLRWEVWQRDDFTCIACGSRSDLSADHIRPERKGGTATLDNLQTLCRSCNSRKGSR